MTGRKGKRDLRGDQTRNGKRVGGRDRTTSVRPSLDTVKTGRRRPLVFFTLAAVTLGAAGYLLAPALFGRATPIRDNAIIDVTADMGGFDRSVIRATAGEPVTIRLTSLDNRFHIDGAGRHQFAVDELGVNIIAPAQGSASETFTPSEPGTYVFYCDICCGGRANPTMSGKLVVEA